MKGESLCESDVDLYKKFDIAVQLVKSLPQSSSFSPSYAEATKIYSYFKQSKFGPCSIPRPGFWDVVNRAKWDAWSALGDTSPETAMKNYVEEIKKVYYRIKDIEAFEEKHVEFADVLIPFCQVTGTEMTTKLMEIVKEEQTKLNEPTLLNGSTLKDDVSQVNGGVDDNGECNGNGYRNSHSSSSDDFLISKDITKVSKTVKFEVSGDEVPTNNDIVDDGNGASPNDGDITNEPNDGVHHKPENTESSSNEKEGGGYEKEEGNYEKEEGELSCSEEDSDDEEIYCDSLGPDQIAGAGDFSSEVEVIAVENNTSAPVESPFIVKDVQVTENDEDIEVTTEPQLFSPVSSNSYLDTTAQNILRKSEEHSCSSSNNSKSEYELVEISMSKETFENVSERDAAPVLTLTCNGEVNRSLTNKKRCIKKTSVNNKSPEKVLTQDVVNKPCHCGLISQKKDTAARQSHSGHAGNNKSHSGSKNRNSDTNASHTSNSNSSHHHHTRRHNYRGSSDGSSNGHSGDDTGTSSSSSSSDNVGLKIVKALERMDDNMHLILKRLDSIDNSMKILAEQPPQPWWFKYLPSKSLVVSAIWPFVVQMIVYYFWRRRRRRQLRECKKSLVVANLHQT